MTCPRLRRLRSGVLALVRLRRAPSTRNAGGVHPRLLDRHPLLADAVSLAHGRQDLQLTHGVRWTPCTVGAITATRPIGRRVRLTTPTLRVPVEGPLLALVPSEASFVHYRVVIGVPLAPVVFDLPLSYPVEVLR